jgi:hypothetical protein
MPSDDPMVRVTGAMEYWYYKDNARAATYANPANPSEGCKLVNQLVLVSHRAMGCSGRVHVWQEAVTEHPHQPRHYD